MADNTATAINPCESTALPLSEQFCKSDHHLHSREDRRAGVSHDLREVTQEVAELLWLPKLQGHKGWNRVSPTLLPVVGRQVLATCNVPMGSDGGACSTGLVVFSVLLPVISF